MTINNRAPLPPLCLPIGKRLPTLLEHGHLIEAMLEPVKDLRKKWRFALPNKANNQPAVA